MTKYIYKRIKAGIENTIEMKDETEKGIIEEFGDVKTWLETLIHEEINLTFEGSEGIK